MMKILLITDRTDAAIGLRLAGAETALVRNKADAEKAFDRALNDESVAILLITSEIEKMCKEKADAVRQAGRPLLSTVPDSDKASSISSAITDYIANAIGLKLD